jgi:magnesium-transporting ATPase (P-type)
MKIDNTTKISILLFFVMLFACAYLTVAQPAERDTTVVIVTVTGLLLGATPIALYIAATIFSLLGAAINTILEVDKGIKQNPNSPNEYSKKYFWKRNFRKVFLSVAANLLLIRFLAFVTPDDWQIVITSDWLMLICVVNGVMGFTIDKVITWAKPHIPWLNTNN